MAEAESAYNGAVRQKAMAMKTSLSPGGAPARGSCVPAFPTDAPPKALARVFFASAGLKVDESDPVCWRIGEEAWRFWPIGGHWEGPRGVTGSGGARLLAKAIIAVRMSPRKAPDAA